MPLLLPALNDSPELCYICLNRVPFLWPLLFPTRNLENHLMQCITALKLRARCPGFKPWAADDLAI